MYSVGIQTIKWYVVVFIVINVLCFTFYFENNTFSGNIIITFFVDDYMFYIKTELDYYAQCII